MGRRARAATRSATSRCCGSEWNGIYRDVVRDFWRGQAPVADFAARFTGSSDLYEADGRTPFASINFVTAHDGFTLRDLVSYNEKHNEANLEDNRDGTDDNRSWNCGVEGETDDPRSTRCAPASSATSSPRCFLSQGMPMLLGGDEMGRTQGGNNNAWCQDNEISWFDWELDDDAASDMLDVHAAADRAAPRPPGRSAARRSSRARPTRARACPTSGGSAPTAGG